MAISNNRVVAGAFGYGNYTSAAYLFMDPNDSESGQQYSEMSLILAGDGVENDYFGSSVAIEDDVIVIGASGEWMGAGAVYVFRIIFHTDDNGTFHSITQLAKITAANGEANDGFGKSVALHGNRILVGASGVANVHGLAFVGSAYLFYDASNDQNHQVWTQITQFQPNDLTSGDDFGWTVALDGTTAVVGTYAQSVNAAYVFEKVNNMNDSSSWTQTTKLTGSPDSWFGYAVALAGNWIAVSADTDDYYDENGAGAVVIFQKMDSSIWTQATYLTASDGMTGDWFGSSVAFSKDASSIVVGANWDDFSTNITTSGSVYLFWSDSTTSTTTFSGWTQAGKFVASDGASGDQLGSSIAIENRTVVAGAPRDDSNQGSVYVIDTGFSTMETMPTASPTDNGEVSKATSQPTLTFSVLGTVVPTTESTSSSNAPTDRGPLQPPTPTEKPNNNATHPESETSNTNSTGVSLTVVILLVVIVVAGVAAVVLMVIFFNKFCTKDRQELMEQQQTTTCYLDSPPLPSHRNTNATAAYDGSPIMVHNLVPAMPVTQIAAPVVARTTEAVTFVEPFTAVPPFQTASRLPCIPMYLK